jgi:hypothetical protein
MILNCWSILLICGRWTPGKDFWERIKDYWCGCSMQTTNLFIVSDLDPMATCIRLQAQRCAAATTANRPATLGLGGRGWGLAYGFCPLLCSIYRGEGDRVRGRQVNFTRAGGGAVVVPCLRTLPITTHDRIAGYAMAYMAYPVDPPLQSSSIFIRVLCSVFMALQSAVMSKFSYCSWSW